MAVMKYSVAGILFFIVFFGFSQQKHFSLEWASSKRVGTSSKAYDIPYFKGENFHHTSNGVQFFSQWQESNPIAKSTFRLRNVKLETITSSTLYQLSEDDIPEGLQPKLTYTYSREIPYASVKLNAIFKENGTLKRVRSFDVSYAYSANKTTSAKNPATAVLAGTIGYKFQIDKSGIYKIDKSFIASLGVSPEAIDPRKIKIYGQGGMMLPLINKEDYITDIRENPLMVIGEQDGIFNDEDYILFYALGGDQWNEESQTHKNLFSEYSYYVITFGGSNGKRIANAVEPLGGADVIVNTFDDYQFYEKDETSIAKIGRRWFGADVFDIETERTYNFVIPNLDTSFPVTIGVKPAAVSGSASAMKAYINGQDVITFNFAALTGGGLSNKATEDVYSIDGTLFKRGLKFGSLIVTSENISVTLNYNKNGNPTAVAYLDYITLTSKRFLTGYGEQFKFTYKDAATAVGVIQYNISNASEITQVWDITDTYSITAYPNILQSSAFSFKANLGTQNTYVAVDDDDFYTPTLPDTDTTINHQNLKGTIFTANGVFTDVDYLIITPEFLKQEAQRLADFHKTNSGLNTKVVTLGAIYDEFNAGNPDIAAIRNFIRYVYENASEPSKSVKYICLFGDASVDYKDRLPNNTNVVPVFHSYDSFDLSRGIASDDFYAMMDIGEGTLLTNELMDIAVGRMIANTPQQMSEMVDKVIAYHSIEAQGNWRNNLVLISDDVDLSWEGVIQRRLDELGDEINANKPFINIKKIHTDAYKQEVSAGGERYPQAKTEALNMIDLGALVVNYFGHGNEEGLAVERIYSKEEAQNLRNKNKYPLFITVTCEFTRFDNPLLETVGELTYWNKEGGAIGLITTTRQIFVSNGISSNNTIAEYLFSYGSDDYPSIAEALRRAKTDNSFGISTQNRVVFYIGDPALKLAIPSPKINLTTINDIPVSEGTEIFEALSLVKLEGTITDAFDNLLTNYNGTLSVAIYDKNIERQTLANDGTTDNSGNIITLDFTTLGETIFRGKASVKDGKFSFEFVVPKDIAIPVGNGRISFYAQREGAIEDHTGSNTAILVGGINENAPEDTSGPEIQLYMNNENFVSGGITNSSPLFLASLSDENGINTASGIGHDIIAYLDGNETSPILLNDYYEAVLDDYTHGKLSYPLRALDPGVHTLTFRAWDVYNNSSTAEIQFTVLEDNDIRLERVLNYPNPFTSYTEFWFNHNRPFEPLEVHIQVFTVSGKLIWTARRNLTNNGFSRDISWDGRDSFGDRIGKGVYVYKITVKSTLTNTRTSKFEKLVIL